MAGTRLYTYLSITIPLLILLIYLINLLLLSRPKFTSINSSNHYPQHSNTTLSNTTTLPLNTLTPPIVWFTVVSSPLQSSGTPTTTTTNNTLTGFQTKPHSVLRHTIAGLASFHSCSQTHTSSRKQFTPTVKGYEYLCPSPSPWYLRGVLPSPILPLDGHSVLTLNLTLPQPPQTSTSDEDDQQQQSPAPCVLNPLGRTVVAEFHIGFMSLTETSTASEWPVSGPEGLVLNPSLLNVVGIKMGAWLGREVRVRDTVMVT